MNEKYEKYIASNNIIIINYFIFEADNLLLRITFIVNI